ncbi:hypothetical protein BV25DRAFT_1922580 [Artomyces pyxidatus]|uniref:Uncharacterized protein n=1 Tax=Artomyces pyxidatus TaxID=48021 RepID=A0ACB8SF82_9AGAM|nr:hypothetical protein BV25DRAFT_1922580 [Artomyces pyxidatus]
MNTRASNKGAHPGAPDVPARRRTSAQVRADDRAKKETQRIAKAVKANKISQVAALENSMLVDEVQSRGMTRMPVVLKKKVARPAVPVKKSTAKGKAVDGATEIPTGGPSSQSDGALAAKQKKVNMRNMVDARRSELNESDGQNKRKATASVSDVVGKGRSYQDGKLINKKQKVATPSGLVDNWRSTISHLTSARAPPAAVPSSSPPSSPFQSHVHDTFSSDEDVEDPQAAEDIAFDDVFTGFSSEPEPKSTTADSDGFDYRHLTDEDDTEEAAAQSALPEGPQ